MKNNFLAKIKSASICMIFVAVGVYTALDKATAEAAIERNEVTAICNINPKHEKCLERIERIAQITWEVEGNKGVIAR